MVKRRGLSMVVAAVIAVLLGGAVLYFGYSILSRSSSALPGGNVGTDIESVCRDMGVVFDGENSIKSSVSRDVLKRWITAFRTFEGCKNVKTIIEDVNQLLTKESTKSTFGVSDTIDGKQPVNDAIKLCNAVKVLYNFCLEKTNCGQSNVWACIYNLATKNTASSDPPFCQIPVDSSSGTVTWQDWEDADLTSVDTKTLDTNCPTSSP